MTIRDLPRGVSALLRLALPEDWRDDILRDLAEAWCRRRAEWGSVRSRLWLWLQALAFVVRFAPERLRELSSGSGATSADLKLALRSAAKAPGVTGLAVVSLGIGIGAALGGFSVVRGVLRDLPYPGGERIMLVTDYNVEGRFAFEMGYEEYARRREALTSFEYFEAFEQRSVVVGEGESAAVTQAIFATPDFLRMTEMAPALGRLPDAADVLPGAEPVVVLPHATWVRLTGSDPGVVGETIPIGGVRRTVIGVMPDGFGFPWSEALWIPFDVRDVDAPLGVVAKLQPGVALASARAEMNAVARPDPRQVRPGVEVRHLVTQVTRPLVDDKQIYLVAVPIVILVLLLMVMATNVANLVLARNAARGPELAVRGALGASRSRIVGQLASEVLVMVVLATALGLWLSHKGTELVEAKIDLPAWTRFDLEPLSLVFVVGLAALVTFIAGVAPALRATGRAPADALRDGGRGGMDVRFGRITGALIITQITICVGFLSSATLLGQSLMTFGFERYGLPGDEVIMAQIYFGWPEELNDPERSFLPGEEDEIRSAFMRESTRKREEIAARVMELPRVRRVAYGSRFPGNESEKARVEIEGRDEPFRLTEVAAVSPGYFDLMDAGVEAGRSFTQEEHADALPVVLVNEPFVREYLRGANPLGRRIRVVPPEATDSRVYPWVTVVGVVPDLGLNPGNPGRAAAVYSPLDHTNIVRLAVRMDGPMDGMTARLMEIVREVDERAQVQWTQTLAGQMAEPVMIFRALGIAFLVMGSLALILAAASIHALTAATVTRRTREIGIRQALGADARRIVGEVLRRSTVQLAVGGVLGTGLALGMLRLARGFPWEVRQGNPLALALVVGVLATAGVLALAQPLRRALSVRPADAMRSE